MHPLPHKHSVPPETKRMVSQTHIVAIAPQAAMKKPRDRSPQWLLDQPAHMSAEEITSFLGQFKGKSLEALRNLLVDSRNEPYTATRVMRNVNNILTADPWWIARHDIENQLKEVKVGDRKFRLVSKVGKSTLEVQLWQLRENAELKPAEEEPSLEEDELEDESEPVLIVLQCPGCFQRRSQTELQKNPGGVCDDCVFRSEDDEVGGD